MSSRREARRLVAASSGGIPLELVAGPCMEVFGTDDPVVAKRRHGARRRLHLLEHHLDRTPNDELPEPLRLYGARMTPWSWTYLRQHDPKRLGEHLRRLGLRAAWVPSPLPAVVLDELDDVPTAYG